MDALSNNFSRLSSADDVTEGIDLTGKVALVTGANSGLGLESARTLAFRGAHVICAARTLEKAREACGRIIGHTSPIVCELSDLHSVVACADRVLEMGAPLDILMCNAGIMAPHRLIQRSGVELQFLTNHLGHFLLINRLLDAIIDAEQGRVVILSSAGHTHSVPGGIDFQNLSGDAGYNAWKFYGQSKLANILTSNELARRLEGTNATSNAVHPGVIRTNLARNAKGFFSGLISVFAKPFERTVQQGAATQCYVATHPQLQMVSGKYFVDCKPVKPSEYAQSSKLAHALWRLSEEMVEQLLNPRRETREKIKTQTYPTIKSITSGAST